MSAARPHLRDLEVGDAVPDELYVLDYADGERPRWTLREVEELKTGGRVLVLVDIDTAESQWGFTDMVALRVITHANKTLRTQPYMLGCHPGYTLCDMDQQGRHAAPSRKS